MKVSLSVTLFDHIRERYMFDFQSYQTKGWLECVSVYAWLLLEGFEYKSFPLKFNLITFKYKIHSVEVDLYYLK